MPVERREARRVTQKPMDRVVSEEGPISLQARWRWIHEDAERRTPCVLDGSRACGVDSEPRTQARCSKWNHQPKSRMRETRTSGSVRDTDRQ
jgi:hypothetical protein